MIKVVHHRRFYMAVLLSVAIAVISCASYPSEPQKPEAIEDRYEVNEDTPLRVPVEDGILANDLPGEGSQLNLTSVGKITTRQDALLDLAADGSFTYTPKEDFFGIDSVAYTIRNEKGGKASGTIILNVRAINDPPRISPIADQIIAENTSIDIPITVFDDETPYEDLVVVGFSDNEGLVPAAAMSITGDGGNRILRITPQLNQVGYAAITMVVRESDGPDSLTAQTSFTIVVSDVNSPPALEPIPSQTTLWRTSLTITLIAYDEETPVEELELAGTSSDQNLIPDENIDFRFNRTGWEVTLAPENNALGTVTITITITDTGDQSGNNPQSATRSFDLDINFPFVPFSNTLTNPSFRLGLGTK